MSAVKKSEKQKNEKKKAETKRRSIFDDRLNQYYDELKELYMGLYNDEESFEYFLSMLKKSYKERKQSLRGLDIRRAENPDMHHSNNMVGMMLYTENFAGDLNGGDATGFAHAQAAKIDDVFHRSLLCLLASQA